MRQLTHLAKGGQAGEVNTKTIPSIGTELYHISSARSSLVLREMGGSMIPVWPRYFSESELVLFVVDGAAHAQLAAATIELFELLQAHELKGRPMLIILNKCDLSEQIAWTTLQAVMRLEDILAADADARPIACIRASALTGAGVPAVLQWLADHTQRSTASRGSTGRA